MNNFQRTDPALWRLTPEVANLNGGVALWDVPPRLSCAYNPIPYVRTKYWFRTADMPSPYGVQPNYILTNGTDRITFQYATKSDIFVHVIGFLNGQSVSKVYSVGKGNTQWLLSNDFDDIRRIDGVGLHRLNLQPWVSDGSQIYICAGVEYSDALYFCNGDGVTMFRNDAVDSYALDVNREDGTSRRLTYESFAGVTVYDVAPVLRQWMDDTLAKMTEEAVADACLSVRYRVSGAGLSFGGDLSVGVNAVAPVGHTPDLSGNVGKVLTKFGALKRYKGYPFDVSVIAGTSNVQVHFIGDGSELVVLAEALAVSRLGVPPFATSVQGVPVVDACVPFHPFYCRWVNSLGGVDYFMFSGRQTFTDSVKSVSEYSPFVLSPEDAGTNRMTYAMTTDSQVKVGAAGLTDSEYSALSDLPFSNLAEWYDIRTGRWTRLAVAKYEGRHSPAESTHSFEITFNLPRIDTRF